MKLHFFHKWYVASAHQRKDVYKPGEMVDYTTTAPPPMVITSKCRYCPKVKVEEKSLMRWEVEELYESLKK